MTTGETGLTRWAWAHPPVKPRPDLCEHQRPDHQALIRHLADALGLDLPALAVPPEQVWSALIHEVRAMRAALRDIADVDPIDAALDSTRPLRIAEAVLARSASPSQSGRHSEGTT